MVPEDVEMVPRMQKWFLGGCSRHKESNHERNHYYIRALTQRACLQAALEKRLKLEFKAQSDVKMAELRLQARAKREQEHRAAREADNRYGSMLSFPDQTRKVSSNPKP